MKRQPKKIFSLLILAAGIFVASCNDFIVPNLSKQTVTLLSPSNNYRTSTLTLTFWWDEVKGADVYNLQIVKPNFSNIQQLVLDSNVTTTKFSFTLQPGNYQWRVKAKNNGGSTAYTTYSLTIDSTSNISGQQIVLISPADKYMTNSSTNTFKWDTLNAAAQYEFQIINTSSSNTLLDVILHTNTFTYTLNSGQYLWQVRAQNANSNTPYSSRTITIDTIPPDASTPLLPANGDTVFTPDTLHWSRNSVAIGDSLFIYPDSLISSTLYKNYTTDSIYPFSAGIKGKNYFWRLKSVDAASNWSGYSTLFKFTLK